MSQTRLIGQKSFRLENPSRWPTRSPGRVLRGLLAGALKLGDTAQNPLESEDEKGVDDACFAAGLRRGFCTNIFHATPSEQRLQVNLVPRPRNIDT